MSPILTLSPYSTTPPPQVFLCLSPERLCAVEDSLLLTEALAGTYPSEYIEQGGATGDEKTITEHGKVTDFIQQTLSEIGEVTVQSRELLRMRDVVHFRQVLPPPPILMIYPLS